MYLRQILYNPNTMAKKAKHKLLVEKGKYMQSAFHATAVCFLSFPQHKLQLQRSIPAHSWVQSGRSNSGLHYKILTWRVHISVFYSDLLKNVLVLNGICSLFFPGEFLFLRRNIFLRGPRGDMSWAGYVFLVFHQNIYRNIFSNALLQITPCPFPLDCANNITNCSILLFLFKYNGLHRSYTEHKQDTPVIHIRNRTLQTK